MTNNSRESKVSKVLRFLLSFVLFGMISLLSLSICAKSVFLNPSKIEKFLTSYEYVNGIRNSVIDYADDFYIKNGLNSENLDEIFDYENTKKAVSSYASFNITSAIGYTNESYTDLINDICVDFDEDLKNQIENSGQNYNADKAAKISASVREFFKSEIDIPYIEQIKTVLNIGSVGANVILGVSAFFAVSTGLVLLFLGTKRYRSIRAVSCSFSTAGIFNVIIALTLYIISTVKNIDIYPIYLHNAFMNYFYMCIGNIALSGGVLILISLAVITAVWKIKKGS